ncbi:hypothetical protein GDO78_016876 [Eleutherodactylus coqui]|uniref:Tumor necrosis factor n=1 Tax=Eleutherodactylus coqui TaxID=57060 RepID=A0A8J6JWA5_ELECQ|nr:hypothetical protein GDO78_016876 [Eleutherodactylus coqui]
MTRPAASCDAVGVSCDVAGVSHDAVARHAEASCGTLDAGSAADTTERGKLTWTNDGDNCFTQGGLTLKDNKLHVGQTGLYFVYAQLTFGGSECPPNDKNFISLSVILQSTVHNEPIQLFRADKTPCELAQATSAKKGNYTRRWNKSIFQGALFKLEKGDELYVKSTENEYLKMTEGANYFGAYAL